MNAKTKPRDARIAQLAREMDRVEAHVSELDQERRESKRALKVMKTQMRELCGTGGSR